MDWDIGDESDGSSDASLDEGGLSDADAAALGMDTRAPDFYDPEADDRDEAWMQKMRRSHRSDAILSCPLCFTTVCIDCQQHERFENQFRAMFVMNCRVRTNEAVALPTPPAKRGKQRRQQQRQQQQQAARDQRQQQDQQQQQQRQEQEATFGEQQAAAGQQQGQEQQQQVQQAQQQQQAQQTGAAQAQALASGSGGPGPPGMQQQEGEEARMNPVCCAVCDTELGLRDPSEGVYHFFNVFASNS